MHTIIELNEEFVQRLQPRIHEVWNTIAFDAMEHCDSNFDAMEFCVDADRIATFTSDGEAQFLVRTACVQHGYGKVVGFLSQHITIF